MDHRDVEVYFINYKNSVQGTGGVGTVSRDMVKYYPNIHFLYWDGSNPIRESDLGIKLPQKLHETVHSKYAKAYLWPVLHGLPSKITSDELTDVRNKMLLLVETVAKEVFKFSNDNSRHSSDSIYWINDYTSIPLISMLRKLDNNSTIIFTFRTPFGIDGLYPEFFKDDIPLLEGLLQSDCITFHRQKDLNQFVKFVNDKFPKVISRIISFKNYTTIVLTDNKNLILSIVPMGNNKKYRKNLLSKVPTKQFYRKIKNNYRRKILITGVSRFEESKGIEYEIDCVNMLLQKHPKLVGKFVFLRYSYMSKNKKKSEVYNAFRDRVVVKINDINSRYGTDKWQPIVYDFGKKLNDCEVAGLLMASDILLIAPHADGFNHLALEAIYSQKKTGAIQLLLSDIGVTDYIHGCKKLSHNIEDDVKILYESIGNNGYKNWLNQQLLNLSAGKLSSKEWMSRIIELANDTRKAKNDKSCNNNPSK